MIKTYELRKAIHLALKSIHPRVWFQTAPDGAAYPYLIYDLPNAVDDGSLEQFVLDVDGWDAPEGGNTVPLESLMHEADKALNGLAAKVGDSLTLIVYRDNRLALRDDDPKIIRRKHVYQVRTFERS